MKNILFICMGNICRSAMAEGILRDKIQRHNLPLTVDSAGTHSYHNGEKYDSRARAELKKQGVNVDDLRSRRVSADDFKRFDALFVADKMNLRDLRAEFGEITDKVQLMTKYSDQYQGQEIPDPYYGGEEGFAHVYAMLDESISAWLRYENLIA